MQKNVFFLKQLQWGMNHGALGYRQCQCCIGFCLCLLGEMYPLFPNFRSQSSPHSFIDFQQPPSTCPAVYPSSFSLIHFYPPARWTESKGARSYWRIILHCRQDPWPPFPAGVSCVTLRTAWWVQWPPQPPKKHRSSPFVSPQWGYE